MERTKKTSFLLKSPSSKRGGAVVEAIFCYNLEVSEPCQVDPIAKSACRLPKYCSVIGASLSEADASFMAKCEDWIEFLCSHLRIVLS